MSPKKQSTFEVSKTGLAKLLERRGGKAFAITELIQNAWDEDTTKVEVSLTKDSSGDTWTIIVEDDNPEGFKDLSHAYTLFAESEKKWNPEKRGRFNLGEKMVIAICDEAHIYTTKGAIGFDSEGRWNIPGAERDQGSLFKGVIRLTDNEVIDIHDQMRLLIPPENIATFFDGKQLKSRPQVIDFTATLETEWADEDGRLHRNPRKTLVTLHEVADDERPMLYEMGIPVVETGDRWHINVHQKVPLNSDRDNVTPAYLRAVRAEVLNHAHELLSNDDASEKWVSEALEDKRVTEKAVHTALDKRFGKKRVIYDPSDPEGSKIAMSHGYTVIAPRSLSKKAWGAVKKFGAAQPAGQVTPSPKPFSDDPNAPQLKTLPEEEWTEEMRTTVDYATKVGEFLLGQPIRVVIAKDRQWKFTAAFGDAGVLTLNLSVLGESWFKEYGSTDMNALLIHEFAHGISSDHLSKSFHEATCRLGARLVKKALEDPHFFSE